MKDDAIEYLGKLFLAILGALFCALFLAATVCFLGD